MMKTIKVSEKGQIAIPQIIRENLNIHQGDELILLQINGKLLIEKVERVEKQFEDDFKDILKFSETRFYNITYLLCPCALFIN